MGPPLHGQQRRREKTIDLTLETWLTAVIKGLCVSISGDSLMTRAPKGVGIISPLEEELLRLVSEDYVVNLYEGSEYDPSLIILA